MRNFESWFGILRLESLKAFVQIQHLQKIYKKITGISLIRESGIPDKIHGIWNFVQTFRGVRV